MSYLIIQNRGEAPVEAFCLLGASMSRENEGLIGQFGSGAKLAITTLLRKGLEITVYTGNTRMEFKTKDIEIKDGLETKTEKQVFVQFGGTSKRKQDLGWVVGFGELDWQDTDMAIREFVANAIDQTVKRGDNIREAYTDRDLAVEFVPDTAKRAQKGYTRVFIEADSVCERYVEQLHQRFLHFAEEQHKRIIPKEVPSPARIYLEGVYVCTLDKEENSLCDYNLRHSQVRIDESRNLNTYVVRAAIASLYQDAECKDVERVLEAVKNKMKTLETELDPIHLSSSYYMRPKSKETWQKAWNKTVGEQVVACSTDQGVLGEMTMKKGHSICVVPPKWMETLTNYGIKTVKDVLDKNEKEGRKTLPPTFEAIDAVKEVWGWITATGLQGDRECPKVQGFDELTHSGSETLGFYEIGDDTIYIRNDVAGPMLYETVLEELAHYCTQAADYSRDFQNFLTRIFVRWMK